MEGKRRDKTKSRDCGDSLCSDKNIWEAGAAGEQKKGVSPQSLERHKPKPKSSRSSGRVKGIFRYWFLFYFINVEARSGFTAF